MPHVSEISGDFKTRFGYQEHCRPSESMQPSVRGTPDLLKSVLKETPFNSSAVSSFRDRGDYSSVTVNLNDSFEFREDPSFWKDHNVQVIIRVRPLSNSEIAVQGPSRCVKQGSSQSITWTGPPEARFTFDHVADEHVSQEMLFKVAGVPMVENCMGGYNSCMFAYGQTGSGKTHTMLGDIDGGSRRHSVNSGMTPRVFEYLFTRIQKDREARREEKIQYTCKCSFLEIYNEQILDLLDPSSTNLQIREDTKKGVYVDNLTEIEVISARDVIQQLIQGAANRKVASTNMNRASSRSHSVFTCIIESKWVSQGVTHHRFARLNLVDLAGSERQKSSGAEGERLKEATNINKSLSTLGLVIMNLVNVSNGKSLHVPYRDSKLTFLLQDSLGGNSKTTIIANISPSSCCSLETLSTLKFAQRAKFIKNHATINEDASGDVLAMRMQIQQLKKEVSRLQNVINGGTENHDDDAWTVSFPGSPGSFKWEGIHGSFSPVSGVKRMSQKKEYEVALVGAFRREKDKDITLQALTAESQAAMQLAKQREDEIQGLKMRLRFREAAIKRLEGVASGKISAETHLLKEKEEHLKELEVLRSQVDRNQEVTRFAMENLRLKEEIRRLKSFFEEGEKQQMDEQMRILEDKLLEALEWKLMNELEASHVKEKSFDLLMDSQRDGDLFSLKDPITPCRTEKTQFEFPLITTPNVALSDQRELQTMVDAIAAASQREAEAHETAIILSKENDDLRLKLKMLLDDNNKLIELYDRAVADSQQNILRAEESKKDHVDYNEFAQKELEMKRENENLEHQLAEMHEENDKLLGLYEKAMQERDELKRLVCSSEQKSRDGANCVEKLVEVDGGDEVQLDDSAHALLGGSHLVEVPVQDEHSRCSSPIIREYLESNEPSTSSMEVEIVEKFSSCDEPKMQDRFVDTINILREKLDKAQELLSKSSENVTLFSSLEREIIDIDRLSREIQALEGVVQMKRKEYDSSNLVICDLKERENMFDRKLTAVRYSMANFSSSLGYFEQREAQAKVRTHSASSHLKLKKMEFARLQASKAETERAQMKIKESEVELKNNMASLKQKIEEEKKKREKDTVLLAIDNVENSEVHRNWQLGGKATELLKSEEEKTKLQLQMNHDREKLEIVREEGEKLSRKLEEVDQEMQVAEMEIQKCTKSMEEMENKLQSIVHERKVVSDMKETGRNEFENMLIEFVQNVFERELKEEETRILREEMDMEMKREEGLKEERSRNMQKMSHMVEETTRGMLSEKLVQDLESICSSFMELSSVVEDLQSNSMAIIN
ncbi:kinesin-like protein KIN-12E [Cynara cardunculus var. scolymus]|uniref:kinesin-like protein KIN-12E n=1 Tax=Cynara cardunculus var. scolymus TaxID=59895 RepID=UPI000D626351|nr:kinesin-like protein KIN-12E [Cynara cardunculus var. scolymus]